MKYKSILDFPFGQQWEREVLHAAGVNRFITIKVTDNNNSASFHPELRWKGPGWIFWRVCGPYVSVGREQLKTVLSDEGLASFLVQEFLK